LELLLSKLDITQLQDPYNRTPLCKYHHDPRITDKFGRSPFWIATKKGHHAVLEFLSKECGLTSLEEVGLPDHGDDAGSVECNVCTSVVSVVDFHYH
ncbi:hypothetical protein COCMIDRAFT_58920, partial [Bipolaris oryzae ATCC 44560]